MATDASRLRKTRKVIRRIARRHLRLIGSDAAKVYLRTGSIEHTGDYAFTQKHNEHVLDIYRDSYPDAVALFAAPLYARLVSAKAQQADRWRRFARQYISDMEKPGTAAHTMMLGYRWKTRRQIMSELRRLVREIEAGEAISREEIALRFEARMDTVADGRSRVVGLTEAQRVLNVGQFAAANEAANDTNRKAFKTWEWSGISRKDHAAIHGKTGPMNALFNVGGEWAMYPLDTRLSAAQSVNCGCSLTYNLV